MIKLDIHSYCHNCPRFKPVVTHRPEAYFCGEYVGSTIVQCVDRAKCQSIYKFILDDASKGDRNA